MRLRILCFSAAIWAAAAVPIYADTVDATFNGLESWSYTTYITSNGGASSENVYSNEFEWTKTGGTYTGIANSAPFSTYCIDIADDLTPGNVGSTHHFTISGGAASLSDYLGGGALGVAKAFTISELLRDNNTAAHSNGFLSAALQVAIWEVVAETTSTIQTPTAMNGFLALAGLDPRAASGTFYVSDSAIANEAYTMLTTLDGQTLTDAALVAVGDQSQVFIGAAPAPPVPLPGAAAAAIPILMLGGTTLKSKRRRRQAEESAVA